ncbi:MAG: hypothetical protein HRT35_12730 [Algicola sp.]|nr:hypothetical protein [Algicola sp.]
MNKITKIMALNLLIGNVIAWNMGSAPIDFPVVAYSDQELQLVTELAKDSSAKTELGALYSLHNELDKAEHLLSAALKSESDDPLAQAWLGATRAKQAGAMFDPLMGLVKLYRLHGACADVNAAVAQAPDNFEVHMIRLATFAPTNVINCSVETALKDEVWFKQFFAKQGKNAPLELKMQFNLAMSKAYVNIDNPQQATIYLNEFKQLAQGQKLSPSVEHELAQATKLLGTVVNTSKTQQIGEHS